MIVAGFSPWRGDPAARVCGLEVRFFSRGVSPIMAPVVAQRLARRLMVDAIPPDLGGDCAAVAHLPFVVASDEWAVHGENVDIMYYGYLAVSFPTIVGAIMRYGDEVAREAGISAVDVERLAKELEDSASCCEDALIYAYTSDRRRVAMAAAEAASRIAARYARLREVVVCYEYIGVQAVECKHMEPSMVPELLRALVQRS